MLKDDYYFGYIYVEELPNNKYIGAVLVTDVYGVPVEFKYTEPIVPTKVQEILYGKVLKTFIKRDVISYNLIKNIEKKPEIYFVDDPLYFELYNKFKTPFIFISDPNEKALEKVGIIKEIEKNIFLFQLQEASSPLKVEFYDDDKKLQDKLIEIILKAADKMDIVEPFQRIAESINNIEFK
jgi:hypothetical protein